MPAPDPIIPFGTLVRDRRRALRLSLAALGARVGCAKSYLSAIETGHKPPPQEDLVRGIERALAVRDGRLLAAARAERTPRSVREELRRVRSMVNEARQLASMIAESGVDEQGRLEGALRAALASGEAHRLAARLGGDALGAGGRGDEGAGVRRLPVEVPLIGTARAVGDREGSGSDAGLGSGSGPGPGSGSGGGGDSGVGLLPRSQGSVLVTPGVTDPDAYAVRVVGETMSPELLAGDLVVASPLLGVGDRVSDRGGEDGDADRLGVRVGGDAGCASWADGSLRVVRLSGSSGLWVARVYAGDGGRVRLQPSVSSAAPTMVSARRVRSADAVIVVVRRLREAAREGTEESSRAG